VRPCTFKEARKKPYSPPQLRVLIFKKTSLFLVGHAWNGDINARDLLEHLFPRMKRFRGTALQGDKG
jgi:hypothetical protein